MKKKTTKQRNSKFEKLKPLQQCVAIAEDAIKQLKREKFIATPGFYAHGKNTNDFDTRHHWNKETLTARKAESCSVCAVGAAALSVIRLDNKFDREAVGLGGCDCYDLAGRFFSRTQLNQMERHFEGTWRYEIPDANKRAQAIFRNIVKNKGEFIP